MRREPPHASADYDAVSEDMVEKHCLERYLALEEPAATPVERKQIFEKLSTAQRRALCTLWQPVHRSARISSQSSGACCGMDSSTCHAWRCCGDCGLSKVGYSHEHCGQCHDLMKCQRCEQINNQRGFGLEFPETKACYENLKAKRVHNGACLREPVSIVTAGYGAGAARG